MGAEACVAARHATRRARASINSSTSLQQGSICLPPHLDDALESRRHIREVGDATTDQQCPRPPIWVCGGAAQTARSSDPTHLAEG